MENIETLQTLDQVFKGDSEPAEQVDPVIEDTQEPDTKEPEAKEAKVDKTEPTSEEEARVPVKAVQEERRKRQALEKELAELRKNKDPEPQRPNAAEDPEGAIQHTETAIEARLTGERINSSRNIMLAVKEDYSAMEQIFVELAKSDPRLVDEMRANESPAMFAYNKAKEHLEYQEFKNWKAEKAKPVIKPDPEEDAEEERKQSALTAPKLTRATSAATNSAVERMTLKDVYAEKKRK
jgi:hypothetical protein